MARPTNEERDRRAAERDRAENEAKQTTEFGGSAYLRQQHQLDDLNAIDERKPNWRPSSIVNIDTQEPAPDDRQFAGDEGKALNQMVGRVAITENTDPQPAVTRANNPVVVPSLHNLPAGEGEEVQLLRGYQPDEGQGATQGIKRQKGEVLRLPAKEARKLVNLGAAKFTETD